MFEWLKCQQSVRKASRKRCVFRSDLNTATELACLIAGGRAFHSVDPATEKARRPSRSRWYRGIVNRCCSADLSVRVGMFGITSDDRYTGQRWCTARNTSKRSLNSIRWRTGNQCKLNKTGVMWSRLRVPVISRAAEFWIICSFRSCVSGSP